MPAPRRARRRCGAGRARRPAGRGQPRREELGRQVGVEERESPPGVDELRSVHGRCASPPRGAVRRSARGSWRTRPRAGKVPGRDQVLGAPERAQARPERDRLLGRSRRAVAPPRRAARGRHAARSRRRRRASPCRRARAGCGRGGARACGSPGCAGRRRASARVPLDVAARSRRSARGPARASRAVAGVTVIRVRRPMRSPESQPSRRAAGDRLAGGLLRVPEGGERGDERLLPDGAAPRHRVLAEHGQEHRPRGRRADAPAAEGGVGRRNRHRDLEQHSGAGVSRRAAGEEADAAAAADERVHQLDDPARAGRAPADGRRRGCSRTG